MLKAFKKLWNNDRGNILVIGGAALPLLVGSAGLATDTIQWALWKRQLQRAADSAAVAGVYTRVTTDTEVAVEAAVDTDLELTNNTGMVLLSDPDVDRLGDVGDMQNRVQVTLELRQELPFSSMFMSAAPIIRAKATAASVPGGAEYCVIAKDPSATRTGLTISGSTWLDLGDCSLIANSSHPTNAASNGTSSANGGQGSTVKAKSLDAQGGVNFSTNWQIDDYNPGTSPVDDPFTSFQNQIPTSNSGCSAQASLNKTNGNNGNGGNVDRSSDSAGQTICLSGDQTIAGTVTLGPATYVIDAGNLEMTNNNASLSCNGCTIILTNFATPANTGSVKLTGGSLNLSPPRSVTTTDSVTGVETTTVIGNQDWEGIALYQDPRATDDGQNSPQNKITGNSDLSIQGVVYFGSQSLEFVGGGKDVAACLQIVGMRVTFTGNSKIEAASKCGNWGLNTIGGGRVVRLVG